jgi:hypothetical protein
VTPPWRKAKAYGRHYSSVGMTMDVHRHVADGMQQAAAEQIDNVSRPIAEKWGGKWMASRAKRPALRDLCR